MFDILCVTNRSLVCEDFLDRMEKIVRSHPRGIILREKDMTEQEYEQLAEESVKICLAKDVPCILHTFYRAAIRLGVKSIHLPLPLLRKITDRDKAQFEIIGSSCHSVEEAREAEVLGAAYLIAGHIYPTDCKKGLSGRGCDFLKRVCESVRIPVYAIGGIDKTNAGAVVRAKASGICIMSSLMQCSDPQKYLETLRKAGGEDVF